MANGDSLDHNFALADAPRTLPRLAARLEAASGDLSLEISTTEPGLQVYDGSWLAVPVEGHNGRRAGRHNGICLEPQRFPDAIHHPHFPDAVLWPGQEYKQRTEYRFLYC